MKHLNYTFYAPLTEPRHETNYKGEIKPASYIFIEDMKGFTIEFLTEQLNTPVSRSVHLVGNAYTYHGVVIRSFCDKHGI
jgi:predicted glycoside hydrolase/deacetylase ChbG (UPF0249 family)